MDPFPVARATVKEAPQFALSLDALASDTNVSSFIGRASTMQELRHRHTGAAEQEL